ncbi:hypothetical protein KAI04_05225 [Candidatus Pacearchaeota archaeon]|nr:hypothetical protein [Candidatus Pacearchaeota archaeon]
MSINKTNHRESISLAIPFYGEFKKDRIKLILDSMNLQKGVSLEVVVVEQSENPSLKKEDLPSIANYFHIPISNKKGDFFCPGIVRNVAVSKCKNKIVYSSDGDIIFQNPYFFKESIELLRKLKGSILLRPPVRRLPIECFSEFKEKAEYKSIKSALERLDKSKPYIATTDSNKVTMKIFKKFESGRIKTFLYTEKDYENYKKKSVKGYEPFYSTLEIHAGGTLMLKNQFEKVGGFCLRFAGWGCQDADLQWKLKESFGFLQFPNENKFEVLHLDHPKSYFSKDRWMKNREIQQSRRGAGIESSISEDLVKYNG